MPTADVKAQMARLTLQPLWKKDFCLISSWGQVWPNDFRWDVLLLFVLISVNCCDSEIWNQPRGRKKHHSPSPHTVSGGPKGSGRGDRRHAHTRTYANARHLFCMQRRHRVIFLVGRWFGARVCSGFITFGCLPSLSYREPRTKLCPIRDE